MANLGMVTINMPHACSLWMLSLNLPLSHALTTIVITIVIDHKHNFPLKYVVLVKTTANSGYIFVCLHLLQLPTKEPSCCRARRHVANDPCVGLNRLIYLK